MHKHDGQQFLPISLDADAALHLTSIHGINLNDGGATVHNRLHALEQDRALSLDEVTTLRDKVATLEQERDTATRSASQYMADLANYKVQVRDAVIEAKDRHNLCDEGTNEFLTGLGLDPLTREYDVTFTRLVRETTTVTVEASGESEAEDKGRDDLEYGYPDWDVDEVVSIECSDVCES